LNHNCCQEYYFRVTLYLRKAFFFTKYQKKLLFECWNSLGLILTRIIIAVFSSSRFLRKIFSKRIKWFKPWWNSALSLKLGFRYFPDYIFWHFELCSWKNSLSFFTVGLSWGSQVCRRWIAVSSKLNVKNM
jgi:hypothetical protein